jgi:aspartate-semialdehyde dehydrogenase
MSQLIDVAVVGATGVVGEAMLDILAERKFPVGNVHALASERSVGKTVSFGDQTLTVSDLAIFDFAQCGIALFSAGASVSGDYAPKASAAGCIVIDNTSRFRYDDDVPLIVPEVNPEKIADHVQRGIIANPNCSTIQMVVALKPSIETDLRCGGNQPYQCCNLSIGVRCGTKRDRGTRQTNGIVAKRQTTGNCRQ